MELCSFEGCNRKVNRLGLCRQHYRMHLNGDDLRPIMTKADAAKLARESRDAANTVKCSVEDCEKWVRARGLCTAHYSAWYYKEKNQNTPKLKKGRPPSVPTVDGMCVGGGCDRPAVAKGFCNSHYAQMQEHGQTFPIKQQSKRFSHCLVCGNANDRRTSRGFCSSCGSRYEKYGLTVIQALMLDMNNATCYICGHNGPRMAIDHDHSCCDGRPTCGKCTRGILCSDCNYALGFFNDDISKLESAVEYLNERRIG